MIKTTDQLNRIIELPGYPKKIISLVPSQTELLFDLGLREEVIGITKFCIHPNEWFRNKIRIGGTKKLNIERIKSLNPDLIIANKEENNEEEISILFQNFPLWISDIKNLDDAINMIRELSKVINKEQEGILVIKSIESEFEKLKQSDFKTHTCAYIIWNEPMMTVGGDTFISKMMNYAGFKNVFEEKRRYPVLPADDLKNSSPEIILLSSEPYPFKEKNLQHFRYNFPGSKVVLVDGEMFSWYGSRLIKTPSYLLQLREKINSAL